MKKLILGLFLTVGTTASVFARNNDSGFIIKEKVFFNSCTIVNVVTTYDSCGNKLGSSIYPTSGTGSQCDNAVDGIVVKNSSTNVPGCKPKEPTGPVGPGNGAGAH